MKKSFYLIVDNVRSLENVGSLFRTADAMSVDKVFLCGITGTPPNTKISKTALGAEECIEWEYYAQSWRLVEKLQKENISVVCLEQGKGSVSLSKFNPKFPIALVVGNEVKGVSQSVLKKADVLLEIPMTGKKESLNVAVAFGISAFEINQKRLSL
ncbi:MAG: RNA methyltransferase [Patescibacteria group bacterium]|nr:RNA methyltransferase [Patescibacteria group bacterium]